MTPTGDFVLRLPSNVTLASGRSPTEPGGLLHFSQRLVSPRFMIRMDGWCSRITGLRLRGPSRSTGRSRTTDDRNVAIIVRSENSKSPDKEPQVLIDNNEMFDWPGAGIHVGDVVNTYSTAQKVRITRNFIHHNLMCNQGYGVEVYGTTANPTLGGYAFIDRNVFTYNRHAIAGDGHPATGFVAERNLVLSGGKTCHSTALTSYYEQHFDMHGFDGPEAGYGGVAGERISIRYNTVRGEQEYGVTKTRPVFWLRGTPSEVAEFYGNVLAHDDRSEAIRNEADEGHFLDWNNRYDINTSDELAVGDFDGDGADDVFQATGTVWAYSARGQSDWRIINARSETLSRLRFGDFDGNGTTDVFTQQGDRWLVSYGGTTGWRTLPFGSPIEMSGYRVGDFDGDGRADLFRADGRQWSYSRGGAADWEPLAGSSYGVDDVQFGDFNGDGATDVFGIANGEWSVSVRRRHDLAAAERPDRQERPRARRRRFQSRRGERHRPSERLRLRDLVERPAAVADTLRERTAGAVPTARFDAGGGLQRRPPRRCAPLPAPVTCRWVQCRAGRALRHVEPGQSSVRHLVAPRDALIGVDESLVDHPGHL